MKIVSHKTNHSRSYCITPDGQKYRSIDVYRSKELGSDEWKSATVSWSSIGSVEPIEAEQFAQGILRAVKIARELNTGIEPAITEEEKV
jgi:hypothetical protein